MSVTFFVTDCRDHVVVEIEKLDPSSSWRKLFPPWPVGSLLQPAGMVLADDGRLVVVDRGHHRLVVLSADRLTASVLAPDGDPIGSLWEPTGIALSADGSLFVADTGNHRLVRCESIDTPVWSTFGTAGFGSGQFEAPTGVAVDSLGKIVIADPGLGRVVRIDGIDGAGWLEVTLPTSAAVTRPYGVAAGLGGILIADPGASRVLLLSVDSAKAESVTTVIDGSDGSLPLPVAAVALDGALYVADLVGVSIGHFAQDARDNWKVESRLLGEPGPFPSPRFSRIGGFIVGSNP
jgi:sugar lactone lactonase YvrE